LSCRPCARGRATRGNGTAATPLYVIGNWLCLSQTAVCPNPSEFGTHLGSATAAAHCGRRAARRRTGSHHKAYALADVRASSGMTNSGGGSMERGGSGVAHASNREQEAGNAAWLGCLRCSRLWRAAALHKRLRHLTFDMRGGQRAQPFGRPLDEGVRCRL
jgi:hypothetical protein